MLSSTSEKKLRYVRAFLLAGWLLLIFSLFWDPYSHVLTDAANSFSPFAPWVSSIQIQGQWVEQVPYALGNRLFWTLILPLLPLSFMVLGHETWRRICPLSFVSQIPGYLNLRRMIYADENKTERKVGLLPLLSKNSWVARNALMVQFGLLFLGLCCRLWFANSDRSGLAYMLLVVLALALLTGYWWGGKTWCNYFCPIGVVQKIYTEPRGLFDSKPHIKIVSLPQSMCRTPGQNGDRSACVGCTPSCPDIDLEKSYWENLISPQLKRVYFAFLGLIWGFYSFFYFYAGNWDYYFSGIWTHEDNPYGSLLGPGLFIANTLIPIPKILAVPLVLGVFVVLFIYAGQLLSRLYLQFRKRLQPDYSEEALTHQVLIFTAYLAINSFYFFGGRPTLNLLPAYTVQTIDLLIGSLTTIWFLLALRRSSLRYKQEGLAPLFLKQLKELKSDLSMFIGTRKLEDLDADELCMLAAAPGLQSDETRLGLYRDLLVEYSEAGASPQILARILDARTRLGVTLAEHLNLTNELQIYLPISASTAEDGNRNQHLVSLMSYRMEVTELFRKHYSEISKVDLNDTLIKEGLQRLMSLFQITKQENELILDQVLSDSDSNSKLLFARLEELVDLTAVRLMLRSHRGQSEKWDVVSAVISRVLDEQVRQVLIRFLSTLRLIPEKRDSHAFALMASMYSGSMMDEVLESSVPTETHHAWYQVFPSDLVLSLASTHQDESQFSDGVSKKLKSLPRLHSLISNENRAIRVLSVKIQTESSCMSAMAYFLLSQINLGRANLAYEERLHELDNPEKLWLLTELYHTLNGEQNVTSPTNFEKFLLLSNSPLLNKISIEQIAEIARNAQASVKKVGDVVVQRGELLQSVHLLYEGVLGMGGRGKPSRDISAGEFIGLAAILSDKPYAQTIRVVSAQARMLSISSKEIIHLVDTDHQIASTLLRILAETI
jgi:hypothetical protein